MTKLLRRFCILFLHKLDAIDESIRRAGDSDEGTNEPLRDIAANTTPLNAKEAASRITDVMRQLKVDDRNGARLETFLIHAGWMLEEGRRLNQAGLNEYGDKREDLDPEVAA